MYIKRRYRGMGLSKGDLFVLLTTPRHKVFQVSQQKLKGRRAEIEGSFSPSLTCYESSLAK